MTNIIRNIRDRFRMHRQFKHTVRELSQLSDRDLKDLGINRGDIEFVAHKSVTKRFAAKRAA